MNGEQRVWLYTIKVNMNKPHLPVFVKEEKKEGIVVAKTRHGASTKALLGKETDEKCKICSLRL